MVSFFQKRFKTNLKCSIQMVMVLFRQQHFGTSEKNRIESATKYLNVYFYLCSIWHSVVRRIFPETSFVCTPIPIIMLL